VCLSSIAILAQAKSEPLLKQFPFFPTQEYPHRKLQATATTCDKKQADNKRKERRAFGQNKRTSGGAPEPGLPGKVPDNNAVCDMKIRDYPRTRVSGPSSRLVRPRSLHADTSEAAVPYGVGDRGELLPPATLGKPREASSSRRD